MALSRAAVWVAAALSFIAWYPLTYRQEEGVFNLALTFILIGVNFTAAFFSFVQVRRQAVRR